MLQIVNKRQRIPKRQSKLDNPEKLVTCGTQDDEKQNNAQYNMYWTPLFANKLSGNRSGHHNTNPLRRSANNTATSH